MDQLFPLVIAVPLLTAAAMLATRPLLEKQRLVRDLVAVAASLSVVVMLAFLAYGRHGIDWSVDRNVLDLHLLVIQQLIDHLLMVMSDSRYTDPCCFYNTFGNGELFFQERDDGLPFGVRG